MSGALGNNGGRLYSFANQPALINCSFTVDSTNGLGITSLKGQGVQKVYMHTSGSPTGGNPNPAAGYAMVQLSNNYNAYLGQFKGVVSPLAGSALNIDSVSAALTAGQPYVITSVGHAAAGTQTIAPVADVSGSLASKYLILPDAYGNTWVIWFSVSGVGSKPSLGVAVADGAVGLHYVQQSILNNATAAQIGAALVLTIQNLDSGIAGVKSYTASGTTTVTAVNTSTNPYNLPGAPADGASPLNTGFTLALGVNDFNLADWQGVGLPKGLNPSVGQSFIAKATGSGKSTGQVKAVGVSNILSMEVIGNPSLMIAPQPQGGSPNVGGWIVVQFLGLPSSGQVPLATNPADGSIVQMSMYVDAKLSPSNLSAH